MSEHKYLSGASVHSPFTWVFADSSARNDTTDPNTDLAYASTEIGKVCWQTDDNSFYVLSDTTPTWIEWAGGTGGGSASDVTYDNSGQNIGTDADNVQDAIEQKASYQMDGTRIVSGASFSVNADDNTQWDLAAGSAQIYDFTDRANPTILFLEWDAQTGLTTTNISDRDWETIRVPSI